jgi:hypothetical protein
MSPYVFEQRAKSSAGFIFGPEKAGAAALLIRLTKFFINLLVERTFSFSFSPEPLGFLRSMSIEMRAQVVPRQAVYVFIEGVNDDFVGPSKIKSSEFDFLGFATSADLAF